MSRARQNRKRGFTLGELLIVVAILGVLTVLATGVAITIHRTIRQKQLDDLAGQIYQVAERQLSAMENAGELGRAAAEQPADADGAHAMQYVPGDAGDTALQTGTVSVKAMLQNGLNDSYSSADVIHLLYITPADTGMAGLLLPDDALLSDVRGANWIVEYDAASGNVYGVFYSEKIPLSKDDNSTVILGGRTLDQLRESSAVRRAAGALIGYYGGSAVWQASPKTLNIDLSLSNAEQLQALLSYKLPVVSKDSAAITDPVSEIELTVTDESGHTWSLRTVIKSPSNEYWVSKSVEGGTYKRVLASSLASRWSTAAVDSLTRRRTQSYTLDSLLPQQTFSSLTGLNDGDNINVTVKVTTATGIVGSASVKGNSLFAAKTVDSGTGATTVQVAYARHLQNLNRFTAQPGYFSVVQVNSISFADDALNKSDWYTLYNGRTLYNGKNGALPIDNDKVQSYDGGGYEIKGLTLSGNLANAGLFGTFSGKKLEHIRLVDTSVASTAAGADIGALAGRATKLEVLSDCAVYLGQNGIDYAKSVGAQPYKYMLSGGSGSTLGGLIGSVDISSASSSLSVTESSSSTTIYGDAGSAVGGFFGMLSAGSNAVNISRCYTDHYLSGAVCSGFAASVSGTSVQIDSCYVTGFYSAAGSTAGFALKSTSYRPLGLSISQSYAALMQTSSGGTVYPISNVSGSAGKMVNGTVSTSVYYLNSGSDVADPSYSAAISYRDLAASTVRPGLGAAFSASAEQNTSYYNLNDNALSGNYPYPMLRHSAAAVRADGTQLYAADGLIYHYGDWKAAFASGLVYYEQYNDNSYGFYGANISLLKNDRTVLRDGYAMAYSNDSLPGGSESIRVSFNGMQSTSGQLSTLSSITGTAADSDGNLYTLYLLDSLYNSDSLADSSLASTPYAAVPEDFYKELKVYVGAGNSTASWLVYYFNPFFAKTSSSSLPASLPSTVSVRTARQLYALSTYSKYWNLNYRQEIGIDYPSYTKRTIAANGTQITALNAAVQAPIGSASLHFAGSYDGGGNTVSGVSFAAAAVSGSRNTIGFFGYNAGVLKSIVLNGNYTDISHAAAHRYFGYTGASLNQGSTSAYMGALAGYSSGAISNCAVTGYQPAGSTGTSAQNTLYTYGHSTLLLGGLVGQNDGTVQACSADTPSIRVSSTSAFARVGGLAGINGGSIRQSYAFARLYGTLSDNDDAQYGGFVGVNRGTIEYSYSGSSIVVSGLASKYGFASGSAVKGCYYINDSSGDYYNNIYAYAFDDVLTGAKAVTMSGLAHQPELLSHGFSDGAAAYLNTTGTSFSYPGVVQVQGNVRGVGNWPDLVNLGTVGVVYWEHETGGSNAGWYFSYVDSAGTTRGTLCTEHDDGGVISEYGYGYFATAGELDNWTLSSNYLNLAKNSDDAAAADSRSASSGAAHELKQQMQQYDFITYRSGSDAGELKLVGDYPTKTEWQVCNADDAGAQWVPLSKDDAADMSADTLAGNYIWKYGPLSTAGNYGVSCTNEQYEAAVAENAAYGSTQTTSSTSVEISNTRLFFSYLKYGSYGSRQTYKIDFAKSVTLDSNGVPYLIASTPRIDTDGYGDYIYFALKKGSLGGSILSGTDVTITQINGKEISSTSSDASWTFGYCSGDGANFTSLTAANDWNKKLTSYYFPYYYYYRLYSGTFSLKITTTTNTTYQRNGQYGRYMRQVTVPDTSAAADYRPNGAIILTRTAGEDTVQYSFVLNPFFGNSMMWVDSSSQTANTVSSCVALLGKTGTRQYSVRSVEQLQFINWNQSQKNCTTSVTSAEKSNFTYLTALANTSDGNTAAVSTLSFYWKQAHDIDGLQSDGTNMTVIPIADSTSNNSGDYTINLQAAFTGAYDGQDYAIQNLNVESQYFAVGLFGVTVNAKLENIVMYSNNRATVQKTGANNGAYAIGGLAGIAYSVKGNETTNGISNCAISGYVINDESTGAQYLGEVSVGGLIGVANLNLEKCSAVVDIHIDHNYQNGYLAKWGNYTRVGGLAGSSRYSVTNCYSGGSISVADSALTQNLSNGFVSTATSNNIYVGGLVGGAFSSTFSNLGATLDSSTTTFTNCYTYMQLPRYQKAIRSISAIGAVADRYAEAIVLKIKNCYYLKSEVLKNNPDVDTAPGTDDVVDYSFNSHSSNSSSALRAIDAKGYIDKNSRSVTGNSYYKNMILGCMNYQRIRIANTSTPGNKEYIDLTAVDYSMMADSTTANGLLAKLTSDSTCFGESVLKGPWAMVTTMENGVTVNGKYTYNSSARFDGQNYPFPTILAQGGAYHVHYGDWPAMGIYTTVGGTVSINSILDLIIPQNSNTEDEPTMTVSVVRDGVPGGGTLTVSTEDSSAEPVATAELTPAQDSSTSSLATLVLTGKRPGGARFTLTYMVNGQAYTTDFNATVTANISVSGPSALTLAAGVSKEYGEDLNLFAASSGTSVLTDGAWSVESADADTAAAQMAPAVSGDGKGKLAIQAGTDIAEQTDTALKVRYTITRGSEGHQRTYTGTRVVTLTVLPPAELLTNGGMTTDGSLVPDLIEVPRSVTEGISFTVALENGSLFSDFVLPETFSKDSAGEYNTVSIPVYSIDTQEDGSPIVLAGVTVTLAPHVSTGGSETATVTITASGSAETTETPGYFTLCRWNEDGTKSILVRYNVVLTGQAPAEQPAAPLLSSAADPPQDSSSETSSETSASSETAVSQPGAVPSPARPVIRIRPGLAHGRR